MSLMGFQEKQAAAWQKSNSLLCVGLDPDVTKMSDGVAAADQPLLTFNKAIIDATADLVCAYKPNSAFYEAQGSSGIQELRLTCQYLHQNHPDIPIILDYKRGDIGNTNNNYARFAFDYLGVDAITIHPYFGRAANEPFLVYIDKGIIVLCRSSNDGSGEFQDLAVNGKKLYQVVADKVMREWNNNNNCLLMIGATYPAELAAVRAEFGDEVNFLIPGVGAQGADIGATVKAGINSSGTGIIISSSREIIFASNGSDFADAAHQKATTVRNEINKYRR